MGRTRSTPSPDWMLFRKSNRGQFGVLGEHWGQRLEAVMEMGKYNKTKRSRSLFQSVAPQPSPVFASPSERPRRENSAVHKTGSLTEGREKSDHSRLTDRMELLGRQRSLRICCCDDNTRVSVVMDGAVRDRTSSEGTGKGKGDRGRAQSDGVVIEAADPPALGLRASTDEILVQGQSFALGWR